VAKHRFVWLGLAVSIAHCKVFFVGTGVGWPLARLLLPLQLETLIFTMADKGKKEVILEAAALLFRDRGYSATSMRDLAQSVHLQASSLYNHISGKQEILREICFRNAERYREGMTAIETVCVTPAQCIERLIALHLEVATEDTTSITAFNDEWRHLEEPALNEFIQLRKDYEARFKRIIEKGIADGSFRPVDPNYALYTLLSALRWVYDWYKPERAPLLPGVQSSITRLLLGGLASEQ
jgi:AcrR family transcriptional regulator